MWRTALYRVMRLTLAYQVTPHRRPRLRDKPKQSHTPHRVDTRRLSHRHRGPSETPHNHTPTMT